ncbi:MAG: lytic transglycosylase domain-containing protein [Candidatus Eremiobacteraeota bacterium]|nr:lytic transglycosylase domain-containing protein [Candidatus Eremiobacteraeota bacterium]
MQARFFFPPGTYAKDMQWLRRLFILFCLVLFAQPAHARLPIAARYAQTLREFNPSLDAVTARTLAGRLIDEADAAGLDARFLVALIAVESGWHPGAVSSTGALGLGQFMAGTAAGLRIDPLDPLENLHGVAMHVRTLLDRYSRYDRRNRYALTLSAYNAGSGAVQKYHGIPPYPETLHYVRAVILLWRRLAGLG